jgi:hypothetical protein
VVELFGIDSEIWMASAAATQTIIVAVAAGFAYRQVREAQRTREEQSRPFVVVDLDISDPPMVFLTVSNLGRTIARRVRIEFNPPLARSLDNRAPTKEEKEAGRPLPSLVPFEVFTEEIPSIAPGKVIRTLFDSMMEERREDLPESYRVTVRYEDERGASHTEEMPLGFGGYKNLEYIRRHTIHDVHGQLEKIAREVRRWSASGSGILVVSRDDQREDRALARRHFRASPESSFAPGEASEGAVQFALRRLRERGSRALALASEKVDPREW